MPSYPSLTFNRYAEGDIITGGSMAEKKVLVNLNLNQNELRNAVVENEATAPASGKEGQIYYDSNSGVKRVKIYNGSAWKSIATEDDVAAAGQVNDVKVNNVSVVSNKVANITMPTKISDLTDDTATNPVDKADTLTGLTATIAELNYSDGVTSNIQTQLNAKEATANKSNSYTVSSTTTYASTKALVDGLATKQATISDLSTIRSNATSGANAASTIAGYGDIVTHNTSEFATAAQGTKADSALQTSDIINTLASTATDKALSANMGKDLNDRLASVEGRGRFLSTWNCTTGLPGTNPSPLPYTYKTGDYFIVGTVGATNYKPNGTSYTGTASTTVETDTVSVNDTYLFDGTNWLLQKGSTQTVSFSSIAGQPTDNTNLATALNAKANLASPALTGTPTAPTATAGTNTTQIATTAFVQSAVSANGNIFTANNPALTSSSGECTWTISTTSGKRGIVLAVLDSSSNTVYPAITSATGTLTIKINSTSNIAANSFTAVYLEK